MFEFTSFYREGLSLTTNLFGTTFYVLTGFHGVHVTVGVLMLLILVVMSWRGSLSDEPAFPVEMVGLYWHFVDIVWIVIFTLVYLIPTPAEVGVMTTDDQHMTERAAPAAAHAEYHPSAREYVRVGSDPGGADLPRGVAELLGSSPAPS